ncbi:PAAR-like domain-containing protein [Caballeronia sp. LZ019]|uniref:PAAR-like domain-containing protein n=1 Tax=Caballeronia sp. LZ019 TaxID=3038555 RepID=UPI002866EB49|nr:PAAR-like domain-containing protein [Caballeronia sp. LZ019]MDR5809816.1 DUF4150 domain-containing protein [Caballeronia sp. LZ019]
MASVGIHPPKTPVTKGSRTVAKVTLPNVCKMPGPPAPFVPTALPNTAKSELSPEGFSVTVLIEGHIVAIRGATFESIGDIASKGTGGGLLSANTHGPAKFIAPGSMTVKIEGKNVHLLGDPMLNNCGPGGAPPNTGASMSGADHDDLSLDDLRKELCKIIKECEAEENQKAQQKGGDPHSSNWCDRMTVDKEGRPTSNRVQMGTAKSECAERKVNERKNNGTFSDDVKAEQPIDVLNSVGKRTGGIKPDVIVGTPPNCSAVFDFKTSCPPKSKNDHTPTFPLYAYAMERVQNAGRWVSQIALSRNGQPSAAPGCRVPPNGRYHGMRQDEIYEDVCGSECIPIHPQGKDCADA